MHRVVISMQVREQGFPQDCLAEQEAAPQRQRQRRGQMQPCGAGPDRQGQFFARCGDQTQGNAIARLGRREDELGRPRDLCPGRGVVIDRADQPIGVRAFPEFQAEIEQQRRRAAPIGSAHRCLQCAAAKSAIASSCAV